MYPFVDDRSEEVPKHGAVERRCQHSVQLLPKLAQLSAAKVREGQGEVKVDSWFGPFAR